MLIQFSVNNFRTFKDRATLSFVASNYDKDTREQENISHNEKYGLRLLKSAIIYGANASGKSRLVHALKFMKDFVIKSSKEGQIGDEIDVQPFRLSTETENSPSEFEVIFILDNIQYRYGFEVTDKLVTSEWLYYKPKTKEVELFYRELQNFDTHSRSFSKGNAVIKEGLVRNNALLVSVAAQFNDKVSISVIEWFKKLRVISGLHEYGYKGYSIYKTQDHESKQKVLELLKAADLSIEDIIAEKIDINKLPKEMPKELREKITQESKDPNTEFYADIVTVHKKYDADGNFVENINFSLDDDESSGTDKFFSLSGPVLDVLENGFIFIVDELDAKLHPNLVCKIVSLFNSRNANPKNAQLLFNTHDTNLLSSGLFRRDQIWFIEKNIQGAARLYSLADFKSEDVKKTEAFEENYIRGKYGAVPFLGSFDQLISH